MLELNASLVPDMSCRSPMVVRVRVGSLRLPRRMSLTLSGVRSRRLRISYILFKLSARKNGILCIL